MNSSVCRLVRWRATEITDYCQSLFSSILCIVWWYIILHLLTNLCMSSYTWTQQNTSSRDSILLQFPWYYFKILWWLLLLLTLKRLEVHLCALWNDCNAISWLLFFGFPDCILYTINVNWFKTHFMFKISGKTKIILNMSAK